MTCSSHLAIIWKKGMGGPSNPMSRPYDTESTFKDLLQVLVSPLHTSGNWDSSFAVSILAAWYGTAMVSTYQPIVDLFYL